ncbi:MAG: glycosyltransferase 87 family protein [Pseudomonadota bacterium]
MAVLRYPMCALFLVAGLLLVVGFGALALFSGRFGYDVEVIDMPIGPLVALLIGLGMVFVVAAIALARMDGDLGRSVDRRRMLVAMLVVGALARLALFASEPILEDDYQRYLFDGAVVSAGLNPYAVVPGEAGTSEDPALAAVAEKAGVTLERVNHPEIRTIYPPGAQAFFALAHQLQPFSLLAWRGVVLAGDAATLGLILLLLQHAGRSALWATLYWWNPLVIKELTNSAHMEGVLVPFIMLGVLASVRGRGWLVSGALAVAGAIKLWPLILFPVLMRGAGARVMTWIGGAGLILGAMALCAWPMWLGGLDQSAGVVAYAERWKSNGAMFPGLYALVSASGLADFAGVDANVVTRVMIAGVVSAVAVALTLAVSPTSPKGHPETAAAITRAAGLVAITMFLLSPAQFPWYAVWIAPFLPFLPYVGLIALAVVMPLYYVAFALMVVDRFAVFSDVVVWIEWVPIWLLLVGEAIFRPLMARGHDRAALTAYGLSQARGGKR